MNSFQYIRLGKKINPSYVENFIDNYLFVDGITALRLVEINSGETAASMILENLWRSYRSTKNLFRLDDMLASKDGTTTKHSENQEDFINMMRLFTYTQ